MKTILIPTDFSTTALNAAKYISDFCRKTGTERLILYHSYEMFHHGIDPILINDILIPPPSQLDELKDEAINKLIVLKETLGPLVNKNVVIEYVTNDLPIIEGINQIIIKEKVDLVTIGISGSGNNHKNIIGGNTLKIMRECDISLLIIPPTATFNGIEKSMLACDLHDIAERLPLDQLKELILKLSSKLLVVNVEHDETMSPNTLMKEETILHRMLDDINPEYYYLDDKNKAEGLLMFAKKQMANLIIVVHRKRGLVEQVFHNSITKKLAFKTSIPLFILHRIKK